MIIRRKLVVPEKVRRLSLPVKKKDHTDVVIPPPDPFAVSMKELKADPTPPVPYDPWSRL